jgi:hypothetical protein
VQDSHFHVKSTSSVLGKVVLADEPGNEVDSHGESNHNGQVQRNNEVVTDIK